MVAMHLWDGAKDQTVTDAYGPGAAVVIVVLWTAASLLGGYAALRRADAP
ncbi:hypothetical protein [Streptomyces sp. 6N223]